MLSSSKETIGQCAEGTESEWRHGISAGLVDETGKYAAAMLGSRVWQIALPYISIVIVVTSGSIRKSKSACESVRLVRWGHDP